MKEIAKAVYEIKGTAGRNDKQELLKLFAAVPGFKEVLQFIFNPFTKTGIAAKKLNKGKHNRSDSSITYTDIINYFEDNQTGSDTDIDYVWLFINAQENDEAVLLAKEMVTKSLKIGVTAKTLNNIYGHNFIPTFSCMLGEPYEDNKNKVAPPYIVTEKLDGVRRILIKKNGVVRMYSRSGHEDEGLVEILEEAKHLPDNAVYDGELIAAGEYKDSIALRQATTSLANRNGDKKGLLFCVFDVLTLEAFNSGESKHDPAINRKILLGSLFGDTSIYNLNVVKKDTIESIIQKYSMADKVFNHIKPVPVLGIANSEEDVLMYAEKIWENNGEGVMLNVIDSPYVTKRTNTLLKVKRFQELTLPVVDLQEGTGRLKGMLGAAIVDYKGTRVGVGSGFNDADRNRFWSNKKLLLGKEIEIEVFGESVDKNGEVSLNFPIYKRVKGD